MRGNPINVNFPFWSRFEEDFVYERGYDYLLVMSNNTSRTILYVVEILLYYISEFIESPY